MTATDAGTPSGAESHTRTDNLWGRLFGTGTRRLRGADLLDDYLQEVAFSHALAAHADTVPYPSLRETILRLADETMLHADAIAEALRADGVTPPDIPRESEPVQPDRLLGAIQSDAATLGIRRARYASLVLDAPDDLTDLIQSLLSDKERQQADLRDVYVRLVR